MNPTSQSFQQEAEKKFPSTSDFHFPGMDHTPETANQNNVETLSSNCLELVAKDQMAPKLKFILSNGNRYTFPYAYIVRIEYDVQGVLSVFTSEKEIAIYGQGLDFVEDRLYDNQVKWIKEAKQNLNINQAKILVKSIEIKDRK